MAKYVRGDSTYSNSSPEDGDRGYMGWSRACQVKKVLTYYNNRPSLKSLITEYQM